MLRTIIATVAPAVMAVSLHAQTLPRANSDHAGHMKIMSNTQRQAEVAGRGKEVMPFSLSATTHIFTKKAHGGVGQVVAKEVTDAVQVETIRQHLQEIQDQFLKGDFSGPSHVHGRDMPGPADLKASKPGQISINYKDVKGGGQLTYTTLDTRLVAALHRWFDA